jgi:hypothetical protein
LDRLVKKMVATTSKPKRKNKRKPRTIRKDTIHTMQAPATIGTILSTQQWTIGGKPAKADVSMLGAIRVTGTAMVSLMYFGNTGSVTTHGIVSSGTTAVNYYMTPGFMDGGRLSTLDNIYGYYCIRRLKLCYVPICPTSTSGTIGIGFEDEVDRASGQSLTQAKVMNLTPSVLTSVYLPASLTYTNTGERVYDTDNTATAHDDVQLVLFAEYFNTYSSAFASGQAYIEYTVDYYDPSYYNTNTVLKHTDNPGVVHAEDNLPPKKTTAIPEPTEIDSGGFILA